MLTVQAREFRGDQLGGQDGDEQGQCRREPPSERLADAEADEVGGEGPGGREGARPEALTWINRRRPRRSAAATRTRARSTPTRVAASAAPWAWSEAPNSSAAKVMVWVTSVPVYPAIRVRAHRLARARAVSASRRSGGVHHAESGLGAGQATTHRDPEDPAAAGDGELVGGLLGRRRPPSTASAPPCARSPRTVPRRIRSDPGTSAASATIGSSRARGGQPVDRSAASCGSRRAA